MKAKFAKTKNYDMFEMHVLNRDEARVKAIAESMKRNGFLPSSAIHVRPNGNGKFKVIRGHHRLAEAKRQGLEVYYIVDDTDVTIYELEADTHCLWKHSDFAKVYAKEGRKHYIALVQFLKKHNLTLSAAASLLAGESAGSHNKTRLVKSGKFKIGDTRHAHHVVEITDACREMGIEFATSGAFVAAVSAALRVPDFDRDLFLSKIRLNPKFMNRRSRKDQYLEEIEALYNYRARDNKMPVAFLAAQVGRQRRDAVAPRTS